MTLFSASLTLVGTGLILWGLFHIWPPLTLLAVGAVALRVAWNLDGGEGP